MYALILDFFIVPILVSTMKSMQSASLSSVFEQQFKSTVSDCSSLIFQLIRINGPSLPTCALLEVVLL